MNEWWLSLAILTSTALSYWLGWLAGQRRAWRVFKECGWVRRTRQSVVDDVVKQVAVNSHK